MPSVTADAMSYHHYGPMELLFMILHQQLAIHFSKSPSLKPKSVPSYDTVTDIKIHPSLVDKSSWISVGNV